MATDMPAADDPGQHSPVDTLIDELIAEILSSTDGGRPAKSSGRGGSPSPAGLFDTVRSTLAGAGSRTPLLERLLLAEALASVLANAIAPTLADALAPRIMRAIEPTGAAEMTASPSERTREASTK